MIETAKWEYRLLKNQACWDDSAGQMDGDWLLELNMLGNDGWEVAGVWSDSLGQGELFVEA